MLLPQMIEIPCSHGHLEIVQYLRKLTPQDYLQGKTARYACLYGALSNKHFHVCSFLLSADNKAETVSFPPRSFDYLTTKNVINSFTVNEMETLLCRAVRNNRVQMVEYLLQRGVNVHSPNNDYGRSAFQVAMMFKSEHMQKLLLQSQAMTLSICLKVIWNFMCK